MSKHWPDPPDIVAVYELLGGTTNVRDTDNWQNVKCVLHEDSKPSASLSTGEQKFKCFVCGIWGSGFDLIAYANDMTYWEAVGFARKHDLVPATTSRAGRGNGLLRKADNSRGGSISPGSGDHKGGRGWSPPWLRIGSDAGS